MLQWQTRPPFNKQHLSELSRLLISEQDFSLLTESLGEDWWKKEFLNPWLRKWQDFEISLRNELVKIRANRRKVETTQYLRRETSQSYEFTQIAAHAYRLPSPQEAEQLLDLTRWQFIEELTLGHYFDLEVLLAYGLKLTILERWEKIRLSEKEKLLEKL